MIGIEPGRSDAAHLPAHATPWRACRLVRGLAIGLLAVASTGCGDVPTSRVIEDVREVEPLPLPPKISDALRLRVRRPRPAEGQAPAAGHTATQRQAPYTWTLPAGWTDKPITRMQMRIGSFNTPGSPPGDVSVGVFRRSDLLENVNRWRNQFGAPAVTAEALEKDAIDVAGGKGVLVDVRGTFNGGGPMMGGGKPVEGQRLLGVLKLTDSHLMSVRLLGSIEVVTEQEAAFQAFIASMKGTSAGAGRAAGSTTPQGAPSDGRERLRWSLPAGWTATVEPAGNRVATFQAQGAQAFLTMWGSAMGGETATLGMWANDVNRPALRPEEIEKFTRFPLLGGEALLVDLRGARVPSGGGDPEDTMLLALRVAVGERTYFLKMVGKEAVLEPLKPAFEALARSLRLADAGTEAGR